jgi:hypothetical protein
MGRDPFYGAPPVYCIGNLRQAAAIAQNLGCHRLRIAAEFRDDLVATLLFFVLAFLGDLGAA